MKENRIVGRIFSVQKFSVGDGPGIRTTVFLKGCPLSCLWCHNPEGLNGAVEIEYEERKCIGCGECASVCDVGCHSVAETHSFDRTKCTHCMKCTVACLPKALSAVGREYSVDEVVDVVSEDAPFYGDIGGVTFSGGEPYMQAAFLLECLKACKAKGYNTAVETSGFASRDAILATVPYVDLFLYDYKITGNEAHKAYTGVSQDVILSNLASVSDAGGKIILRCPIIPNINDNSEHFAAIGALADRIDGIISVELEGYHSLGEGKLERLGRSVGFTSEMPSRERMKEICDFVSSVTEKTVSLS